MSALGIAEYPTLATTDPPPVADVPVFTPSGKHDIPFEKIGRGPFLARISKIVGPFGEVDMDPSSPEAAAHLAKYPKYPLPRTRRCSPHDHGANVFIKVHVRFEHLHARDEFSALELSQKITVPKERVRRSNYVQFVARLRGVPDDVVANTPAEKINLQRFVDRLVSVELKPAVGGVARISTIEAAPIDARIMKGRPVVSDPTPEELKALLIEAATTLKNNAKGRALTIIDHYFRERQKTNHEPKFEITISMSDQIVIMDADDYELMLRKYSDLRMHFDTYPEIITGDVS